MQRLLTRAFRQQHQDSIHAGLAHTPASWSKPRATTQVFAGAAPASSMQYAINRAKNLVYKTVAPRPGDTYALHPDHFHGIDQGLVPPILGAPNFRKVAMTNVYGVGIPTYEGVGNVLRAVDAYDQPWAQPPSDGIRGTVPTRALVDAAKEKGRVVWVNLREEPFIYLNGIPHCVFDTTAPHKNLTLLRGISTERIEQAEEALRQSVIDVAKAHDEQFLTFIENELGQQIGTWVSATDTTVSTVSHVYGKYVRSGARVSFVRVPITDETSPEDKDFDQLSQVLLPHVRRARYDLRTPTSFIFNCQMGKGRTTTGMVICSLLIGANVPSYFDLIKPRMTPNTTELGRGNFRVVRELLSLLPNGERVKFQVDAVIDSCDKMTNLRSSIEQAQLAANKAPDAASKAQLQDDARRYLIRYCNILCFAALVQDQKFAFSALDAKRSAAASRSRIPSFARWKQEHPYVAQLISAATVD